MKSKIQSLFGKAVLNEEPASPQGWFPGITMLNSNGDIDTSTVGYDYVIRTTTFLRTKSIAQKFYEVPPADFMTIEVGEGAWLENITQNLEFNAAGDFESGIQNISGGKSEIAEVDVALSPKTYPIITWAKGYRYSLIELKKALAANNWDVVKAKTDALKKNWDLGVQAIAFLGSKSVAGVYGLINQPEPNVDTTTLDKNISAMDPDEFATFVQKILGLYYENSNSTVLPDTFVIPMDDYLGLSAPVSAAFPMVTKLEYLLNAFKASTGNPNFKIHGLAYAMKANNIGKTTTLGSQRYTLYRNDPETVRMSIPAQFTLSAPGTADNYQWRGVAYGQYTGVQVYRPREIYYLDWNVA
jgi:hypothetical protein